MPIKSHLPWLSVCTFVKYVFKVMLYLFWVSTVFKFLTIQIYGSFSIVLLPILKTILWYIYHRRLFKLLLFWLKTYFLWEYLFIN